MAKRFALITLRFLELDLLSGEEDQEGSALMARKMENVGPDQEQSFTGRGRPAGASTGGGARAQSAHGYAGARGEGAAKAREGEAKR